MPPRTHGKTNTKIYWIWAGMIGRCSYPSATGYKRYGGRGIKVCARWRRFEAFYEDMGDCPEGMSLDRLDSDGDYFPENCRWATRKQQNRNTRTNRFFEIDGVVKSLAEWADESTDRYGTIHARLRYGWTIVEALSGKKTGIVERYRKKKT